VAPKQLEGFQLVPLYCWYDSTHIARRQLYLDVIFPNRHCAKGGFIEDRLAQHQMRLLREVGGSSHVEFGTWLFDDGRGQHVAHIDGGAYRTEEQRVQLRTLAESRFASTDPLRTRQRPSSPDLGSSHLPGSPGADGVATEDSLPDGLMLGCPLPTDSLVSIPLSGGASPIGPAPESVMGGDDGYLEGPPCTHERGREGVAVVRSCNGGNDAVCT